MTLKDRYEMSWGTVNENKEFVGKKPYAWIEGGA